MAREAQRKEVFLNFLGASIKLFKRFGFFGWVGILQFIDDSCMGLVRKRWYFGYPERRLCA